jgi:hypothetical protein
VRVVGFGGSGPTLWTFRPDAPHRASWPWLLRAVLKRLSVAIKARDWISTPPVDKCVHGFGERLRKAPRIKGLLDSGENLTKAGFDI